MTEPTEPVDEDPTPAEDEPGGAIVELIERHAGPRHPDTGPGSIVMPNSMRINGQAVYASAEYPAILNAVVVDGSTLSGSPFTVTVMLLARALSIGGQAAFEPGAADGTAAAVIEIPNTGSLVPGERIDEPYVLLNGEKIFIDGGVGIGEMATDGEGRTAAVVTMALKCRMLIIDDESTDPADPVDPGE